MTRRKPAKTVQALIKRVMRQPSAVREGDVITVGFNQVASYWRTWHDAFDLGLEFESQGIEKNENIRSRQKWQHVIRINVNPKQKPETQEE